MLHKLMALGLSLAGVLTMSVLMSSTAQAGKFEVEGGKKVTVTGEQNFGVITGVESGSSHEFGTKVGTLKCTPATFHGVLEGSGTDLTLNALYGNTIAGTGCTLNGLPGPAVHMRSCAYLLTGGESVEGGIRIAGHIRCGPGDRIEITVNATCSITIGEQTFPESAITAENSIGGPAMDIKLLVDITGLDYQIDGNGCPNDATGFATTTDGTYKGVVTLKADDFNSQNPVGFTAGPPLPVQPGEFEVESGKKITVTGEQVLGAVTGIETPKNEFKTKAGVVKCTPSTFDGVLEASGTELTLNATYGNTTTGTGCTISGIAGPTIHMNSCEYLFIAGTTVSGSANRIRVAAHIKCGTLADKIEITASPTCKITIGEQSFPETMATAENSGGAGTAMDVKAIIDITGINYVIDGSGCPNDATGPTTTTDGIYRGVVTLKADEFSNNKNPVALTVGPLLTEQPGEFEVESGKKITVTGEQVLGAVTGIETPKNEFKTKAGVVKCTPSTFDGVLEASGTELTLNATYGNTTTGTGCTISGIAGPIIHMNSCEYLLTTGKKVAGEERIGVVPEIKCGTLADKIEITANSTCKITVGEQSFSESMITAENSGGAGTAMDVKAIIDITGINYVIDGSGCPNDATGPTTTTDGIYRGVVTLKADEYGGPNPWGLTIR